MNTPFISAFTPSQTDPKYLEKILVQRHALLQDSVDRITNSVISETGKPHLLFEGPRGAGKTHFVTLLIYRLRQNPDLSDKLHIAWLNEDETSTSVTDLLVKIYEALHKRYPAHYPSNELEAVYNSHDPKFDLITLLRKRLAGRTPLLVTENLDILMENLGEEGQHELRSFLQENPIFAIVATTQSISADLKSRKKAFFG